jgi:type II secretory pathway pseudopilin PulG
MRSRHFIHRHGLSLIDVIVVLVLVGFLIALWAPMVAKSRGRSAQHRCQWHLNTIYQALSNYRNSNGGRAPRVIHVAVRRPDVSSMGASASDPFKAGGPPPNSVPAAAFLLLRTQNLNARHFICPGGDFEPDPGGGVDPSQRSNFTDVRKNLGYSFFYPYTARHGQAGNAGSFVVAADLNPGISGKEDDVAGVTAQDPPDKMRRGNSNNHAKRGQNVLLSDGSVEFVHTPFVGEGDNIYATQNGSVTEVPLEWDTLLLPTDD